MKIRVKTKWVRGEPDTFKVKPPSKKWKLVKIKTKVKKYNSYEVYTRITTTWAKVHG